MKKMMKFLIVLLMVLGMVFPVSAESDSEEVTILFTHDMHSHFLPAVDADGNEIGGFARLMSAIKTQREMDPDAILVDGGDFSMGSLFQSAYASSALELRMLGAMGYDATVFGNHEFDYLPEGLASMLKAAKASGERLPAIVNANYLPDEPGDENYDETDALLKSAFEDYGVKEYMLLERGGHVYALFGLTGFDSDDCAPNSGLTLYDPAAAAQKVVDKATEESLNVYGVDPIVVALSHSGTSNGEGEDVDLAKAVTGIDVIVSGHSHTTLNEPIVVNDTIIVSAGRYGQKLGVLKLNVNGENVSLKDYELVEINESIKEDAEIAALVEKYKTEVEENYLSDYGMTFDQVLLNNQVEFETVSQVKGSQHESTLGNLFSDAYKWMIEEVTGETIDVAVTANGVIRDTIQLGDISVSDIFNTASLGVGTEGELILIYLTGKDLKTVLEIDASVYPLMSAAGLYSSGVEYSYNLNRMFFNRVDYAMLRRNDGSLEAIEDDKMYKVVAGMYAGQMLGSVKEKSFGLLSVTPRDKDGNPIASDEMVNHVVKDANGNPVKEWYAISAYLLEMNGQMDEAYASVDGRKVVYKSWNPVNLLKNANVFTYALLGIVAVIGFVIVLIVGGIRKVLRKKK
ncbi:MAG: bifunctional metallophosphatase/5'-nucleotidase [Erysipelotrichaceae bacterium]|nr:bifunctional metallophosphatase/5'-nucleotidase [Erysipelotrichaceae bacterium]